LIPNYRFREKINTMNYEETEESTSNSICLQCKGGKMLCGRSRCSLIVKAIANIGQLSRIDEIDIHGAAPPGVFVGRIGYPKVFIGPMIPPFFENTEILDAPERWIGKKIDEIIEYRYSLISAKVKTNITEPLKETRLVRSLQEMAMASEPVESQATLMKKPEVNITLNSESQPFGPSAPLKKFHISNFRVDKRIEKMYYDRDLNAIDAINQLYSNGLSISSIQRAFSMGLFGTKGKRKLVPTRWSITAIDSSISSTLLEEIKHYESIDEYQVYVFKNLDNIFAVILSPEKWKFEWIEAWFPGTVWNNDNNNPVLMADHELYYGRKTYPSIGGCYFSAKLGVAERLKRNRRQASALVLREIHPGYFLPVGVWNVRESVRTTLRSKPTKFDTFSAALDYASFYLTIPLKKWVDRSTMIKEALFQKKISDYS
jgi:hypothetical protein